MFVAVADDLSPGVFFRSPCHSSDLDVFRAEEEQRQDGSAGIIRRNPTMWLRASNLHGEFDFFGSSPLL